MDLRELPDRSFRRHPWEVSRARFFRNVLKHQGLSNKITNILDVGAGDGWFAKRMLEQLPRAKASCWDSAYTPASLLTSNNSHGERMRFCIDRPSERYDLLLLMDVLEHIEDDRAFLRQLLLENASNNAYVLISVPAWQILYGSHDVRYTHKRRYDPSNLTEVLRSAGLTGLQRGGLFHSPLIPRLLTVLWEKMARRRRKVPAPKSLQWQYGELTARAVENIFGLDNSISRLAARTHIELPGLSAWALCRTRGPSTATGSGR